MPVAQNTADAGRALVAIVERALAFQDSRQPQYRAPETETASQLTPKGFPTYQDLRVVANLVKALEECQQLLTLSERPAFRDEQYHDEVHALGMRIGFGALMNAASYAWREQLKADGDPVGGEFVAGPCHGSVVSILKTARAALAASKTGGAA